MCVMFWHAQAHATLLKKTRPEVQGINTLFKTQTCELYALFKKGFPENHTLSSGTSHIANIGEYPLLPGFWSPCHACGNRWGEVWYAMRKLALPANAFSFPVNTMAPISVSASNISRASLTSIIRPLQSAFKAFGLFSWMKPTFFFSPLLSTLINSNFWSLANKKRMENKKTFNSKCVVNRNKILQRSMDTRCFLLEILSC